MKAIKRKILYPVLKLYSPNKILIAILSSKTVKIAYDIVKKDTMNDVTTLTFKASFSNTIIGEKSNEMLVKLENDFYIIKTVKINDEDKTVLDITCESEFTECKGIKCQPLNLIGQSPEELFNAIIASPKNVSLVGLYKWKGTDIVDTFRAVQTEDSVSVFQNWLTMCEKFNAWMELSTDEYGQKWIFLRSIAINNGKFLRKGQGLKSLDITFDTTGIFTRMYGYGTTDADLNQPITFMSINPTGHAYVEDISYYIAKGMTKEEIYAIPRCVQETDYTDSNITTPEELFRITKEKLAKACVPTVEGTISIKDYSVLEDTSITEPLIGEQVIVIDQDIHYSITTQIKTTERKYTENPFDIATEISNVIKYDSILKDLQYSSDVVKANTSINGQGTVVVNATIQGNIDALKTSLIGSVDLTTTEDKQSTLAILFEDKRIGYPTFGAMGFGTKGLCIANSLKTDGTWDWQTFGTSNGFNASLVKTGILKGNNGDFLFNLDTGQATVSTKPLVTSDKQIANTEFVTNKLNERQNIVVGTISSPLTVATGSIDLTISGVGVTPITVINGDYINNTAQVVGVTNKSTDIITVHYINGTVGNCKFNYTYSK